MMGLKQSIELIDKDLQYLKKGVCKLSPKGSFLIKNQPIINIRPKGQVGHILIILI